MAGSRDRVGPASGTANGGRGRLLTAADVGALLGVAPREARRLLRTHHVPLIVLGRKLGVRAWERDVVTWLDRLRQGGAA